MMYMVVHVLFKGENKHYHLTMADFGFAIGHPNVQWQMDLVEGVLKNLEILDSFKYLMFFRCSVITPGVLGRHMPHVNFLKISKEY